MRYVDHVLYNRCDPLIVGPQTRETIGWLVAECEDYITVSWDRDAGPPTLRGGDPKASGMVLLRSDLLELTKLDVIGCNNGLPQNSKNRLGLNSQPLILTNECALHPKKRKTRKGEQKP